MGRSTTGLNTYIESKPLRIANGGADVIFWSERDG
jgi:hypothetical protein